MKKGWRVILGIVLVALVIGALCVGVGLLTGADYNRIMMNLDEHYQLTAYVNHYTGLVIQAFQHLTDLVF